MRDRKYRSSYEGFTIRDGQTIICMKPFTEYTSMMVVSSATHTSIPFFSFSLARRSVNLRESRLCASLLRRIPHFSCLSNKQSTHSALSSARNSSHCCPPCSLRGCSARTAASASSSAGRSPPARAGRSRCSCDRRSCCPCPRCTPRTRRPTAARSAPRRACPAPRCSARSAWNDPCSRGNRSCSPNGRNRSLLRRPFWGRWGMALRLYGIKDKKEREERSYFGFVAR